MIHIKRDENGTHWLDGAQFVVKHVRLYRKKTLTKAARMSEPFRVETLEGTMVGKAGDMLMIGAHGEMYPCDAAVFDDTYEPESPGVHDVDEFYFRRLTPRRRVRWKSKLV